jgi:hypothetical protein
MAKSNGNTFHHNAKDLTNQRFGRLTALNVCGRSRSYLLWRCKCDCGQETTVPTGRLIGKVTLSCGCLQRERSKESATRHGLTGTSEMYTWNAMWDRCYDPKSKSFARYGGRGIKVCDRWLNSVEAFVQDMGPRPSPDHSIERSDNDGDYEPSNCKWATRHEQSRNRRSSRFVKYNGERVNLLDMANRYNLKRATLTQRLDAGWPVEKALLTPVHVPEPKPPKPVKMSMSGVLKANNTSGYRGVTFDKLTGKWRAECFKKKLGRFDTPEEAAAAYLQALQDRQKTE